jgi:hypothetical protein
MIMTKQSFITILLTVLMSMTGAKTFAHDIEVTNKDGVTIYYVWANEAKTELAVSYGGYSYGDYTGDVVIPESVDYYGNTYPVTSIDYEAFKSCSGLTSVTIPNSVTSIGEYAFYNCSGLTSVTIPNSITSIGSCVFLGCSGLTSVIIPNSVTSIDSYAFQGCSSLTSITIPKSVTTIGYRAFYKCSNLTSIVIGSGVTSIGNEAFLGTNLTKTIWLTNTPPSGYTNANGAINYVSNDQFTSLKNTVKYQFLSSYFEVDGIRYVPVSPSERTCDAIDCVYDESAANTKITSTVAYKTVSMNVKNLQPCLAFNNKFIKTLSVDYDGELPHLAFAFCSNMQSATLGQKVSAIGKYTFQLCSSLEAIEIPDIVTVLNDYAFAGCLSLKKVKLGSQLKNINQYAFSGCIALPSITIPSAVANISDYVFYECIGLKTVNIADSESTLTFGSNDSDPIFASCPLDYVYIGRGISYSTSSKTGYSPFYRNTTLREVEITDKETEISENEFYGCTNLQKITLGDDVTTIGMRAFSGCSSLKYFIIGSKMATIGQEAFSDCSALEEIISKAQTPPVCGSQALKDINLFECKLYVPDGCMAVYEKADPWKDFFYKEEGEGTLPQGGDNPDNPDDSKKCETPTITVDGSSVKFGCKTSGVIFHYTITSSDAKSDITNSGFEVKNSYIITVYATKEGYTDSEVASKSFQVAGAGKKGDVNGDGDVNVADHVELTKIIMNQE